MTRGKHRHLNDCLEPTKSDLECLDAGTLASHHMNSILSFRCEWRSLYVYRGDHRKRQVKSLRLVPRAQIDSDHPGSRIENSQRKNDGGKRLDTVANRGHQQPCHSKQWKSQCALAIQWKTAWCCSQYGNACQLLLSSKLAT